MKISELSDYFITMYNENRLSHAFLIETNDILTVNFEIKKFLKSIFSNVENIANLIDNDLFPELIITNPDGTVIKKDAIEYIKERFSNKPVYSSLNVYIINCPELMNSTSYNKLLKFLEEPEECIIGFLVTNNKSLVADTIASRCECICVQKSEVPMQTTSFAEEFYLKLLKYTNDFIWYNCNEVFKNFSNRSEYEKFLAELFEIFKQRYVGNNKSEILLLIVKYLEKLSYNVNTNLLLDSFVLEIGDLIGK